MKNSIISSSDKIKLIEDQNVGLWNFDQVNLTNSNLSNLQIYY